MYGKALVNLALLLVACALMFTFGASPSAVASAASNAGSLSSKFLDMVPPPLKPDQFKSKQELKDYLVKLHQYYSYIARPRFGKRSNFYDTNYLPAYEQLYNDMDAE
jgi:hypothetical protein